MISPKQMAALSAAFHHYQDLIGREMSMREFCAEVGALGTHFAPPALYLTAPMTLDLPYFRPPQPDEVN